MPHFNRHSLLTGGFSTRYTDVLGFSGWSVVRPFAFGFSAFLFGYSFRSPFINKYKKEIR
jgi:hypothetical protein